LATDAGAVPRILALLHKATDKEVATNLALALSNLAVDDAANADLAARGGIDVVLNVLRDNVTRAVPADAVSSLIAVWCFSMRGETVSTLLRLRVLDDVPSLVSAHADDEHVVKHGLLALGLLGCSGLDGIAALSAEPVKACLDMARSKHCNVVDIIRLCDALRDRTNSS
jgi:hypothetical protein